MYQVEDEGGWNLEALEPGASGYIPSVHVETPGNIGNPISAPARKKPLPPESADLIDEIDVESIIITGLLSPSDKTAADDMAVEKEMRAEWDEQVGWVLFPKR